MENTKTNTNKKQTKKQTKVSTKYPRIYMDCIPTKNKDYVYFKVALLLNNGTLKQKNTRSLMDAIFYYNKAIKEYNIETLKPINFENIDHVKNLKIEQDLLISEYLRKKQNNICNI